MSSVVIDLLLLGIAYVIMIYFVATMSKNSLRRKNDSGDDGDGGIETNTPPKIDLPPGVIWPTDGPRKDKRPEPVEF